MKFELNGTKYEITFQHDGEHRWTFCDIKTLQGESITQGVAVVHKNDRQRYCKETGRKISLTNALKFHFWTKNERKIIWDAYLNRLKGEKVKHVQPVYKIKSTGAGVPPSFKDNIRNMWNWFKYTFLSFI